MTDAPVLANPNTLSDRAAMGLPDSFRSRSGPWPVRDHRDLLSVPAETLVAVAEDPESSFARRHAAGTVLGLIGDPRIRPDDPPMVDVPGARVRLGLAPGDVGPVTARWRHAGVIEDWIAKECPVYEVELPGFRIGLHPVTNTEYRRFLEDTGSTELPTSWRFGVHPDGFGNHPVWTVTPEAADAYAAWLSRRTGRAFRLPSEAEWEYAAAGHAGREFPWGAEFDAERANTVEAGPLTTTPIGVYPGGRSPFGVYDMAGNVEEYTADDYRPYPGGSAVADDLAVTRGTYRIARGGSFTRFGDLARTRRRHGWYERDIYAMGFRLAETP
ncbi:SUMF1/EgtB/PvdO family nonheme iron enzyme [Streptomyces roseirectus]|uniref:SUMF1/EgtB/PvdO family nonheme iron enzyme n=1 Tax=Streptomyces roseirectus TaxID=2768066 RepID=A0A7H0I798_9ACTN|nr:SUMF1/EgtB/PvdO family nonheme iron enzyme [Streptomyces roseirectus]QNP68664.1 SUMF1/EgtB/PvdO family nonheme iron enzyme [Streptomyces roseirectus]